MRLHGTAVEIDGKAIVLRGESGAGKSDLALRLLDFGFRLIGDDQLIADICGGVINIQGDPRLAGRMEVRGIGICSFDYVDAAPLALIVDLTGDIERLPEKRHETLLGISIPLVALNPFELSAPQKLKLALGAIVDN